MRVTRAIVPLLMVLALRATTEAQTILRLTLPEARALAVRNHPLIKAASMNAFAAEQVPDQVQAERYPNLQIDLTGVAASDNSRIGAGDLTDSSALSRSAGGLTFHQLLYDFGRNSDLVQSSRLRAKSARQTAASVRSEIILEVDRKFFAVLRAQALEKVAVETVESRRLALEQTGTLRKHEIKSGLDVSVARYSLAEAELLLVKSRNDVEAAFAALSEAIGSGEPHTFELADPPLPEELISPCDERAAEGVRDRPDVKALEFDRAASFEFLKAEEGLRKPVITALWGVGYSQFRDPEPTPRYNAAGINIRIPFLNGRLYEAREAEAAYKVRAADEQLRDARNRVARDVRIACLEASTAYQRMGLASQLVGRASETLALVRERFRLGLSSIIELNQALLSLTSAEIERENAKLDYLVQRSVLEYQSGQLY